MVDTAGNVVQQVGAALKSIQGQAQGCQYELPKPVNGQPLDYNQVNVQVKPASSAAQLLPHVLTQAQCDPVTGGWYYDDPAAPTRIVLCTNSCNAVGASAGSKVDFLLGCVSGTP